LLAADFLGLSAAIMPATVTDEAEIKLRQDRVARYARSQTQMQVACVVKRCAMYRTFGKHLYQTFIGKITICNPSKCKRR
jgi:hypothetical protein